MIEGVEHGDGEARTARIFAIRAASGHKESSILDLQRIAAVVKPKVFSHFTTTDAIDGILKKGLASGNEVGTGRADIHFTVFHPLDSRNTAAYKKVKRHKDEGTSMVIVALDTTTFQTEKMRVSTANGYCLCDRIIDVKDVDTISICTWDRAERRWISDYIYMKQLVDYDITAFRANVAVDSSQVAKLLVQGTERPEKLLTAEECRLIQTCLEHNNITAEEAVLNEFMTCPTSRRVLSNIGIRTTPAGGASCLNP